MKTFEEFWAEWGDRLLRNVACEETARAAWQACLEAACRWQKERDAAECAAKFSEWNALAKGSLYHTGASDAAAVLKNRILTATD